MPKKGANLGVSSLPESAILRREMVGYVERYEGMVEVCQVGTGVSIAVRPAQAGLKEDLDITASGCRSWFGFDVKERNVMSTEQTAICSMLSPGHFATSISKRFEWTNRA